MKRLGILVLLLATTAVFTWGSPLCVSSTLKNYLSVAHGGTGQYTVCNIGAVLFDFTNTTWSPTATLGFSSQLVTNTNNINVTPAFLNGTIGVDVWTQATNPVNGSLKGFTLSNASTTATGSATYGIVFSVSAPSPILKGVFAEILGGFVHSVNSASTYQYNKTVRDSGNTVIGNPQITQDTPTMPTQINDSFGTFTTKLAYSSISVTDSLTLNVGKGGGAGNPSTVGITDMVDTFGVPEPTTVTAFGVGLGGFGLILLRRRKV